MWGSNIIQTQINNNPGILGQDHVCDLHVSATNMRRYTVYDKL